ncbi:hypothetical protein ONS95_005075 [Cadophora gregata]|uniref:uncharacterized protein n=1 Tax=Cadophora gregata TaxID=51156 RepID=UPI0026DB0F17|nr:uncharacterized protein ONS95_005075 [Cadophora gregata]KAK0104807.1 hypothetical protein ONS95_005075 [Cadophora gregata]KAK0115109.1 hypothetical protein ONS96_013579 [Cadophora gregata f. sp. sojae]
MGCCLSCPSLSPLSTKKHQKNRYRIHKHQISPPIPARPCVSLPSSSPTCSTSSSDSGSSEKNECYYYDLPAPPLPPFAPVLQTQNRYGHQDRKSPARKRNRKQEMGMRIVRDPQFTVLPPNPQRYQDHPRSQHQYLAEPQDPSPFPQPQPQPAPFHLASPTETHLLLTSELTEELASISILIANLAHSIRAYSFTNMQVKRQVLGDIDGVIQALPRPPRGLLVRQRLVRLRGEMGGLWEAKGEVFERGFGGVFLSGGGRGGGEAERDGSDGSLSLSLNLSFSLESLERNGDGDGLEALWEGFMRLSDEEKMNMAWNLTKKCPLMRIFELLSKARAGSEDLLVLDNKMSNLLKKEFDGVLAELREFDGYGGVDGEKKGGLGETPSMQWRVLGIMEGKRREELRARMEDVKRGRGRVSVALLGVVEGLVEDGGGFF